MRNQDPSRKSFMAQTDLTACNWSRDHPLRMSTTQGNRIESSSVWVRGVGSSQFWQCPNLETGCYCNTSQRKLWTLSLLLRRTRLDFQPFQFPVKSHQEKLVINLDEFPGKVSQVGGHSLIFLDLTSQFWFWLTHSCHTVSAAVNPETWLDASFIPG